MSPPTSQPISHPVNQSMSRLISFPTNQTTASQPFSQGIAHLANKSTGNQSPTHRTNQWRNQSSNHPSSQSVSLSFSRQLFNRSIVQAIDQSVSISIIHAVNQSISKPPRRHFGQPRRPPALDGVIDSGSAVFGARAIPAGIPRRPPRFRKPPAVILATHQE